MRDTYIQNPEYSIKKTKTPVKDQRHQIPVIKISNLLPDPLLFCDPFLDLRFEHVYFYNVPVSDDATRKSYLERAYGLGRDFACS